MGAMKKSRKGGRKKKKKKNPEDDFDLAGLKMNEEGERHKAKTCALF